VVEYLIKAGVPKANLQARGYGETRPVASNASEADRARNRRVEVRILER
jgi:outer membrane protein OmpA-like peptidoglycan-associated protein